uniref:Malate dehydrogenase, glyoxysomal n=1 Tax=Arundo donax TaxID=35708 RepID=A0A0A9D4Q0_ARUDO
MAFAAAKFGDACLRAMRGDAGIVECSYVASEVTSDEICLFLLHIIQRPKIESSDYLTCCTYFRFTWY